MIFQSAAEIRLKEFVKSLGENRISNGVVFAIRNSIGEILAYQDSVDFLQSRKSRGKLAVSESSGNPDQP